MKKIYMTGAPGWLGSRCVELMSKKEVFGQAETYQIRCLVLRGVDATPLEAMGAEIIEGDLTDKRSLEGALDGCESVVHIAGVVHPKRVRDFYEVNQVGTENILTEAIRAKVGNFIYISSNSPAGFSPVGHPYDEEVKPSPYMHYGKSKHRAEQAVLKAATDHAIKATILRPCWYYGPGQPDRQTEFFRMIKKGNPVLFGNGSNLRSMSYIDNVIQGIVLALEKEKAQGETFWIADETPYPTIEIYQTIAELLGVKSMSPLKIPGFSSAIFEGVDGVLQALGIYHKKIHVAGEMSRHIACRIDKAKRMIGYQPQVSLCEGMKRSIEWCHQNHIEI